MQPNQAQVCHAPMDTMTLNSGTSLRPVLPLQQSLGFGPYFWGWSPKCLQPSPWPFLPPHLLLLPTPISIPLEYRGTAWTWARARWAALLLYPLSLCPTHVVSSYRKTFHLFLNSPHQPRNDLSVHSTYTNYSVQSQPLKHFVAPLLSCLSPLIRLWAPEGQALVRFIAFAVT